MSGVFAFFWRVMKNHHAGFFSDLLTNLNKNSDACFRKGFISDVELILQHPFFWC